MPQYSIAQSSVGVRAATRADFIRRTYLHLAGAIAAFAILEAVSAAILPARDVSRPAAHFRYSWLAVIGGFAVGGWVARSFAANVRSLGAQYFGLGLYVLLEAVIFVPLIAIANRLDGSGSTLRAAAVMTGMLFAGLTGIGLTSKRDFRPLGGILMMGGFVALGLIVLSVLFGFTLGVVFSRAR